MTIPAKYQFHKQAKLKYIFKSIRKEKEKKKIGIKLYLLCFMGSYSEIFVFIKVLEILIKYPKKVITY